MKLKRYMEEYRNDILRKNKNNPALAEIGEEIDRVLNSYKRGLITNTEVMRTLAQIDIDN